MNKGESNDVTGKGLINVALVDNPMVNVPKTNEFWKYNSYEEWNIGSKSGDFAQRKPIGIIIKDCIKIFVKNSKNKKKIIMLVPKFKKKV